MVEEDEEGAIAAVVRFVGTLDATGVFSLSSMIVEFCGAKR
jgi:hypothetical protein